MLKSKSSKLIVIFTVLITFILIGVVTMEKVNQKNYYVDFIAKNDDSGKLIFVLKDENTVHKVKNLEERFRTEIYEYESERSVYIESYDIKTNETTYKLVGVIKFNYTVSLPNSVRTTFFRVSDLKSYNTFGKKVINYD